MNFDLTEDQSLLQDSLAELLVAESPVASAREVAEADGEGFSRDLWGQLAELGYLGLVAPELAGGQGLGAVELALVCQEMAKHCFPGPYLEQILAVKLLEAAGDQDELIGRLVTGEALGVVASEGGVWPGQPAELRFEDDRIRGKAYFVPYAASATHLIVRTAAGVFIAQGPFDARRMQALDEAARFYEVTLDNQATMLCDDSVAAGVMSSFGLLGAAAFGLGIAEETLTRSLDYARERETFGKPIAIYQSLQHRMADMLIRTESSRSAVYRAAWCLDNEHEEAGLALVAARAYAVEAARLNSQEAIQIHGGNGFTWEYDLHRYLKRAMTLDQFSGRTGQLLELAYQAVAAGLPGGAQADESAAASA